MTDWIDDLRGHTYQIHTNLLQSFSIGGNHEEVGKC